MCDVVDEEGENSGCWVECTVCNEWYHLDCSGVLVCLYSNLEEFDFICKSYVACYKCRLQNLLLLYSFLFINSCFLTCIFSNEVQFHIGLHNVSMCSILASIPNYSTLAPTVQ